MEEATLTYLTEEVEGERNLKELVLRGLEGLLEIPQKEIPECSVEEQCEEGHFLL